MNRPAEPTRCPWVGDHPLEVAYHDAEWGVPVRDEARLFEMLTLEGAQAGLSWRTILLKREGYRRAFVGFDATRIAAWGEDRVTRLLADASIVRHRGKIEATLNNARRLCALWDAGDTLSGMAWEVVGGEPLVNHWRRMGEVPGWTAQSRQLSRALKSRGFRFIGETTCYAFMQAAGLVNDHLVHCHRHSLAAAS